MDDEPRLGLIESFRGNNGTWHLSFHHVAQFASVPRSEVAHSGWSRSVLKKMMGASARS